jgi:outer membrane protein, heavy metal efflux system
MQIKGFLSVLLLTISVAAQEHPAGQHEHANSGGDPAGAAPAESSAAQVAAQPAGETLTLEAVVREALEKNPAVQSALHTIAAQRRKVPQQRSYPDPMVAVGWAGNIAPFSVQEGDPSSNRNLSVTQQIPYPGKLKLRAAMASKEADALQADYDAVVRRVTADVKAAYFDYFYYDKAIQITQKNKSLLEKLSKISESRYQVGKGMQQDVLRSQVEISLLLQKMTMLEQQRATAQAKLNNLLVRPPESPLPPAAEVQPTALRYSLEELYALAAESDTGVQRESRMVEKSQIAVAMAQKEYRPDLGVGYMYQQRPNMPDMHAVTFSASVPVFYRTKQREGVAQAREELASAEKSRENRLNELKFELRQQYLAAKAADQLLELYTKAVVPQSSLTLESSMSAYRVGSLDFLSMLTNFTTLLNYETDYYRQVADHQMALARMESLIGMDLTAATAAQTADPRGPKVQR